MINEPRSRLGGKVAIVTGAAAGIGLAITHRLVLEGAVVIAVDRDGDALRAASSRSQELRSAVRGVVADASSEADAEQVVRLAEDLGGANILVNNAGRTAWGSILDVSVAEWDGTMEACLSPTYLYTRAVLPSMTTRLAGGSIVNVASINQRVALAGLPAYTAAKGAIIALTKQVAVEYGRFGVRCNAVSPGFIFTTSTGGGLKDERDIALLKESIPIRRLGTAEEVAASVGFLASDDASYVSGSELVVDGAASLQYAAGVLRPVHRARTGLDPLS